MTFGELLRRHREAAAMTQRELAERAGVSAAAVRDLEQGRTLHPQPASVRHLAAALGLRSLDEEAFRRAAVRPTVTETFEDTADRAVHLSVLGPLVVRYGEVNAPFGADRQRTVLGRLALTPNEAVTRAELIDLLWPDEPPESAINLVQTYVTRLRRVLASTPADRSRTGMLRSGPAGYQLRCGPAELDLLHFRELVERARPARPAAALGLLDEALALWRGSPACDVEALVRHPRALALTNERIAAALRLADLADQLSCPDRTLAVLRTLSEQHPLHEPLWGRLILALAAGGLQAAALSAYDEIRGRLSDELGIDPGPELADFHRRVLRQHWSRAETGAGEPVGSVPPAQPVVVEEAQPERTRPFQTPAPVGDFTGRRGELQLLCKLLRPGSSNPASRPVTICAIAGPGGVGKTSLAVQAAHLLRADFPDGQLYADLHGDGAQPARPIDVLSQSLRALGVNAAAIPTDEAECSALYRTTLSDRRVLVVLDNAKDARQVRPLLPGSGCGVIVTSRRRMVDLEAANAIELETMPVEEAVDLLAKIAGPARVLDETEATAAVVRLCGRFPLAVRIAGARLASRPNWTVDTLAQRLGDEVRRLDELRAGDLQVGASFTLSYQSLTEPTARAFRLLAVGPINEWSVPAAAALLGQDERDVEDMLDDLVDCSLLQNPALGRYMFHDLLRLFARSLSLADDGPIEQADALARLYTFYTDRIASTAWLQHPNMVRLPYDGTVSLDCFADCDAALAWLDRELPQVEAIIEHTARQGPRALAWTLADLLRGYFFSTRQATQWFATATAGLSAAQHVGDRRGQAAMYQTLGQASWSIGDFTESLRQYRLGLALAESSGWHEAAGYISHNIGLTHLAVGEPEPALQAYQEALEVSRAHHHEYVAAVTLNDLGMMYWELGRFSEAADALSQALAMNEHLGNAGSVGVNRHNLALVFREMGRYSEARTQLEHSAEIHRQSGSRFLYACHLEELARWHADADQAYDTAIGLARTALESFRAAKDRAAEATALATLGELLNLSGSAEDAARCMRESYALATTVGALYTKIRALIGLVTVHLRAGAATAAADAASEALQLARQGGYRMLEADALVAGAAAGCGPPSELYEQALRLSRAGGGQVRAALVERLLRLEGLPVSGRSA